MKNPNFIHKLANALILLTILSFFLISSYAIENDGQKIPYDTWTINNLDEFEVPPQEKLNDIDLKLIDDLGYIISQQNLSRVDLSRIKIYYYHYN